MAKTRKATHTRIRINILIVTVDAQPISTFVTVLTDGLAWSYTDAWRRICERVRDIAVNHKVDDRQPVFLSDGTGADGSFGQYTVGEIKNELT